MANRNSVAWALVAAVGACSESSDEGTLPQQTKVDELAIPISTKVSGCDGTQAILPLSGQCDTGLPALYRDIDETAPLALAKCVWKTFEAQLSDTEALRFRLQSCANEPEASPLKKIAISAKDRGLSIKIGDDPTSKPSPFLQTYDLYGADGMAFLEKRRLALTAAERDRCIIRPYQPADFTGPKQWANLYEIAPNAAYAAEIEARGEPASACGNEGWTNDGVQFWELRDGEAWFWELGQEAPLYDPRSFTILHKSGPGDGAWSLAGMNSVGLAN